MSRAKNWTFTLNNYSPREVEIVKDLGNAGHVEYLVFGREIGDSGTPHLQGFIMLKQRIRMSALKSAISDRVHLEVAKFPKNAAEYCKKDGDYEEFGSFDAHQGKRSDLESFKQDVKSGTLSVKELRDQHSLMFAKYGQFCYQYVQDNNSRVDVEDYPLYAWQESLFAVLKQPADPRKVIFCVDERGNSGKSWFCHYVASLLEGVQVLLPGKKADLCMMVDPDSKIIFLDATRSKQGEYILYDFLEELKNRYIFSPKYYSILKALKHIPHVVVMMNENPDMNKLSQDRYHVLEVAPDM